jgi:hypothetical protein
MDVIFYGFSLGVLTAQNGVFLTHIGATWERIDTIPKMDCGRRILLRGGWGGVILGV